MACILKRIFAFIAPVETPKSCQSKIVQFTKSIIVGGVSLISGASKNQTTAFKFFVRSRMLKVPKKDPVFR